MLEGSSRGFSDLEDQLSETEQCAFIISFDHSNSSITIEYTADIPDIDSSNTSNYHSSSSIVANLYLTASKQYATFLSTSMATPMLSSSIYSPSNISTSDSIYPTLAASKKKHKPVAQKIRPVVADLPNQFCIIRKITGNPLVDMPNLNPRPPPFSPTPRYSLQHKAIIDKNHPGDFLWPKERLLMHDFIRNHDTGFAWTDNERGSFRPDFFPPLEFPIIPHTPWVERNIPIPPGIYEEVCDIIKKKLEAGVYEHSNSSYRSRWFGVVKKDGKALRLVHSLEPLNKV